MTEPTVDPITKFQGAYRWLSNFYPVNVTFEGLTYPSSEHAYQAAKTLDPEVRAKIAALPTPAKAKKYGSDQELTPLREDWTVEKRIDTMATILREKFKDPELRKLLIATGSAQLVEGNTWGDQFWGVSEGAGANHLGLILMRIRLEVMLEEARK